MDVDKLVDELIAVATNGDMSLEKRKQTMALAVILFSDAEVKVAYCTGRSDALMDTLKAVGVPTT